MAVFKTFISNAMVVEILTPDKRVYEGEAEGVQVPGTSGSFEVLKDHAPIISTLQEGKVRVRTGNHAEYFSISGGLIEVLDNKVIVLADGIVD